MKRVTAKKEGRVYKMPATAIILAGGESRRMGKDKSILPINGIPAIKHVFSQLQGHFDQIIVSSNNIAQHSFDGVEVVKDQTKGRGPLMGIASALRVSRNQINFVVACDIPDVDMNFVRHLIRECAGYDAVIPQTGPTHYEPLFAVYKKDILVSIDESIRLGKLKVLDPLKKRKVKYLESSDALKLKNLNTMKDYLHFLKEKKGTA
jgi:molybdopterin-guanine dinucleotide biosynthesis protein A